VIGIFVVLTAIIVPIGQRLRESNRTSTCEAHLSHVGQALKAYFLDESGVPPMGVQGTITAGVPAPNSTDVDLSTGRRCTCCSSWDTWAIAARCTAATHQDAGGGAAYRRIAEYYASYVLPDEDAKPTGARLRQYKYMPFRYKWSGQSDFPNDARRQLTSNVRQVDVGGTSYIVTSHSSEMPPDDTIITWCNYHADNYKLNRHGQYVVLYWDGP